MPRGPNLTNNLSSIFSHQAIQLQQRLPATSARTHQVQTSDTNTERTEFDETGFNIDTERTDFEEIDLNNSTPPPRTTTSTRRTTPATSTPRGPTSRRPASTSKPGGSTSRRLTSTPTPRGSTSTSPRGPTPASTRRTTPTTSTPRGSTPRRPTTPPTSRPRPMIRNLQRQQTISSIIFNFSSDGDQLFFQQSKQGPLWYPHRPVFFWFISFHFSFSFWQVSNPCPQIFLFIFSFLSTYLTDLGPLMEQNSRGGS